MGRLSYHSVVCICQKPKAIHFSARVYLYIVSISECVPFLFSIIISKNGKGARKVEQSGVRDEGYLQTYVADNPDSLPLDEIKDDARLLVLGREFPTESGNIDVLAVGSQRHSIARRAFVGGVTTALTRAAACSLLVIPPGRRV